MRPPRPPYRLLMRLQAPWLHPSPFTEHSMKALIALFALTPLLAACGGDDEKTTVIEKQPVVVQPAASSAAPTVVEKHYYHND